MSPRKLLLASLVLTPFLASVATAQDVTVGPGNISGAPGDEIAVDFGYTGNGSVVSSWGYNILYDGATAPYEPITTDGSTVDCTRAEGVNGDPLVFLLAGQGVIAVSFGDFSFPVTAIGRDGVVMTCRFRIKADAGVGTTPLACDPDAAATTASDANGNELSTACVSGTLTVAPEPDVIVGPGNHEGAPGQEVRFAFSYTGDGAVVSSWGYNILYDGNTAPYEPITTDGSTVDCTPAEGVNGDPLVFLLAGQGVIAVSFGDFSFPVNAIGRDGVVMTCRFRIKEDAAEGTVPLPCDPNPAATTASDANGNALIAACVSGELTISRATPTPTDTPTVPVPTETPTQEATETPTEPADTPTPTPTTLPSDVMLIKVGRALGVAGQTVEYDVRMFSGSALQVAGTQNDTSFQAAARVAANASNRPDCAVNPAINKGGTSFAFQPPMCVPGETCTAMRSFVLALDNVDPIPSGSVLYTCNAEIAEGANNAFPLGCSNPGGSDPGGGAIARSVCEDGCVDVPEGIAQTVGSGESISTGGDPTDIDPTETTLTSPNAGVASILEEGRCPGAAGPPAGLKFVGLKVTARAPQGSPAAPVALEFRVDAPDVDAGELIVLRNSARVADCIAEGVADPEPCVESVDQGGGYLTAVVLASNANAVWEFAVELPPTPTPTFTEVPTPTATPETGVTNTPTNTPTSTRRPATGNDEDDGCEIVAPADSRLGWLLLVPAAVLILRRRRAR